MKYYSILNKIIRIDVNELLEKVTELNTFVVTSEKDKSDVMMQFVAQNEREECYAISYLPWKQRKSVEQIFFSTHNHRVMMHTLNEKSYTLILSGEKECDRESFLELFMAGFYSYVSRQETMLLHASAVAYRGASLIFVAPSGTGKTTQAELWAKYKGATILNGDKVFLKREDDGIHAWGSPWKGSSPYAENASAPLRAIVALEQAEENSIRKLEGFEVLEYVVPHVFFPSWDERCEQAVLTFLDQVLGETEVYLLKCRPDEEAVELLASTIKE